MSLLKRPWLWVLALIATGVFINASNWFPAGQYECTWVGASPSGELTGDLVVEVGRWPSTYPLEAQILTANGPVALRGWSHGHDGYSREFSAFIPIADERFAALCKLD